MTGDSRENSRTMSSRSESGKSESRSGEAWGEGQGCSVRSGVKSRSWVDIRARRSAVASSVVGGLEAGGGVGGRALGIALGVFSASGVGGGESSRWIWVLLTKKSSKQSSGAVFSSNGRILLGTGAGFCDVGVPSKVSDLWRICLHNLRHSWPLGDYVCREEL